MRNAQELDGLQWKVLLKLEWIIWRYPHFRKPPYCLNNLPMDSNPPKPSSNYFILRFGSVQAGALNGSRWLCFTDLSGVYVICLHMSMVFICWLVVSNSRDCPMLPAAAAVHHRSWAGIFTGFCHGFIPHDVRWSCCRWEGLPGFEIVLLWPMSWSSHYGSSVWQGDVQTAWITGWFSWAI